MTSFEMWKSEFHRRLIENNPPPKKSRKVKTQTTQPKETTTYNPNAELPTWYVKTVVKERQIKSEVKKLQKKYEYKKYLGLTVQEMNSMNKKQLQKAVQALYNEYKIRHKALVENNLQRFEYKNKRKTYDYSKEVNPKSNNINDLRHMYRELKRYIQAPTTVEGATILKNKFAEKLGISPDQLTDSILDKYSSLVNKLNELHLLNTFYQSDSLDEDFSRFINEDPNMSVDDMLINILNKLNMLSMEQKEYYDNLEKEGKWKWV